ncbi:hypothetical protein [Paenibacillus sp. J2TS4]|uniref:hypothetical protein n=1 Tax=Paenibacillus sp. J2TS4 TaxID=2807194 RepID=UPI001B29E05C|nr:hypothetical protein [Paenibacillus sp. J2TS4]GIP36375.1 hypothetical protein J2TS4_55850 [Paenibacillus sp. J2TS4]
MRIYKWMALIALLPALLVLAGCGPSTPPWKEQALSALAKQQEIKSYSFAGEARLKWGDFQEDSLTNPITKSFSPMLSNGKLSWSGTASIEPLRLEAVLQSKSADSSTVVELPFLINNNHLYVNIPLINQKDEYFSLDLAGLSELSGDASTFSTERLQSAMEVMATLSTKLFEAMDEKWFAQAESPEGSEFTLIEVRITDDNSTEITNALREQWPSIIDYLGESGLLTDEQASDWKQAGSESSLELGRFAVAVDSEGFVRDLSIHIELSTVTGGERKAHLVSAQQSYDRINETPAFTQDIPEVTKPLDDILKLLIKGSK